MLNPRSRIASRRFAGTTKLANSIDRPIRIAQITDQHVGRVTSMAVQKAAVEIVNEHAPDLVVLTGDYVAHSLDYLDQLEEILDGVEAPMIGVLGNHDHWSGPKAVRRSLRRAGVEVLDNANTTVTLQGQAVQIVGIDDAYTGHADHERASRGLSPDIPSIGLSHIAEEAEEMWQRGVSLVLSGHTHSGQITLGDIHHFTLGTMGGHKYVHGLYGCRRAQDADGAVYVSAGIGAAVFGLRFGERGKSEVAFFDLHLEPGQVVDEHHTEQPALPGRDKCALREAKRIAQVERKRYKREQKLARQQARQRAAQSDSALERWTRWFPSHRPFQT